MASTLWLSRAGAVVLAGALASCGGGGGDEIVIDFWSQSGLAVADFDGDGHADVALVDTHIDRPPPHDTFVNVYLRSASGMSAPTAYAAAADSWTLMAADLDGDGRTDLVATSISTLPPEINQPSDWGAVTVLLADASARGRFLAPRVIATGGHPLETVAVKLGANPWRSLVQGGPSGGLRIFPQVAPGRFGAAAEVPAAAGLRVAHLAVADLDGDGLEDLAVATATSVYWLRQQADGAFEAPRIVGSGGISLSSLVAADLDGDGRIDLVASDAGNAPQGKAGGGAVMIMLQPGGAFSQQRVGLADGARHVAIGDLDMDGIPDIAVAALVYQSLSDWSSVTVMRQSPAVRGTFPTRDVYKGPYTAGFVGIVDVNGDGREDIVVDDGPSVFLQSYSAPGAFEPYRPLR